MSDLDQFVSALVRRLRDAEATIERLSLRLDNLVREGRVTKLDPDKGTAQVDMNGLPSTDLPISHRAGAISEWNPPSVGERVIVLNPTGEPGLGQILPGGYSDEFAQPHAKGGESFKKNGATSVLQTADKIVLAVGASSLTLEAGVITLKAPSFRAVKG